MTAQIAHEQAYRAFIQSQGVGINDQIASSVDSYVSYLRSTGSLLQQDISPTTLRTERDVTGIARRLNGKIASKTIHNYCSAMRQYIAFVAHAGF